MVLVVFGVLEGLVAMLEYKYLWLVEKQIYVEKVLGTSPSDSSFLGIYDNT